MSLKTVYERFLSSPDPLSLTETATLHYVTTLTSYSQQGPLLRHLQSQDQNVVKKKSQKIISVVEGQSSLAVEVDTTLEFISSGGAYLPGLDNFIVDRTATFPITHIVHFDNENKIRQIRLSWDQGSLLRQVEVIGTRGKSWPIFDGKDQIKCIVSSSGSVPPTNTASHSTRGRSEQQQETSHRNSSPTKKYIKDPHASLNVFEQPSDDGNQRPVAGGSNAIAPRESAKPPPREYTELFAAGHEDFAPSPNGSPNKAHRESVIAPKGAGARKFQTSRLFEEDQDFQEPKIYKTNPARYNHFDIGDAQENDPMQYKPGSKAEAQKDVPLVARSKKAGSQWDFEDFNTPAKVPQRYRPADQVHFSFEDQDNQQTSPNVAQGIKARKDAETHFEFLDDGTPVQKRPAHPKARKDAEIHFEFRDEASPAPAPRRIISRNKAAEGLYSNPLDFDNEYNNQPKAPLSAITNNAGRKKDFESHWDPADDSVGESNDKGQRNVGENKKKAVKSMESHWDNYDQTPETNKKPGVVRPRHGMSSNWSFGDD